MKWFICLFLMLYTYVVQAQYSPLQDRNWKVDVTRSDEFNGDVIDTAKWILLHGNVKWGYANYSFSNAYLTSDEQGNQILRLSATSNDATAGVKSRKENYKYGYYEMSAKLPGFYDDSLGLPSNQGFWTAFWCYHQVRDTSIRQGYSADKDSSNVTEHCEIDILEPCGCYTFDGYMENNARSNEVGHHMLLDTLRNKEQKVDRKYIADLPVLYEDYHKYAAEFSPDKIVYYFDDSIVHITYAMESKPLPNHDMSVVMNNQLFKKDSILSNTPFPNNYDIDYFRFYIVDNQHKNDTIVILDDTVLLNFDSGLWSKIVLGNETSFIQLSSNNTVLRIRDEAEIRNIDITLGADFMILPTKDF